ncbi:MAG: RluA family pseudouridine synthase [Bacteroidales bacterium]|jgi:23S rRNA pseudouridine1911/1915/1917 synthase|nr:RluA family pseudouridine synthase [Bacteroidales bacterium]
MTQYKVAHEGALLAYLFEILPQQSRTSVKNMLSKGQITLNGKPVTAFDQPLRKGDTLQILPKGVSIARATRSDAREEVEKAGVKILFEDEHYLVVDKPSGMLSVSTAHGSQAKSGHREKTLYALLNAYVKINARMQRKEDLLTGKEPDRSTAKVWIVHRLDKGTSGAVIFAKDERAKDLLQSKWKELVLERKYVAWLEGNVEKDGGAVQSWLLESPKSLKMYSYPKEVKDGQLAITHYKVLQRSRHYTQVEFSLETGRKNQIRVHAADLGHPVAGDDKYGAETDPIRRLALHAQTLVFRNPYSQKIVRCLSPLPESFDRFVR